MKNKETAFLSVSEEDLSYAAKLIQDGGTVIFPTETVYGLGADALNPKASEKIFLAKGRPSDNPLIVHIANKDALTPLADEIPSVAEKLMDAFWPGPLTLIFKKSDEVPKTVTGGLNTVAVRIPNQPVARRFLELAQIPVAAPSANLSGKPSPTDFQHCKKDMTGRVDAIIDGGKCQVGVESTVLDISGEKPVLYRPGGVTLEQIEACIGKVEIVTSANTGEAPKSPGLKYKHYAPDAEVQVLRGGIEDVQQYVDKLSQLHKTAVLTFDEFPPFSSNAISYSLGSKENAAQAGARLFAALRDLDDLHVEYIFAPEIPETGFWRAVRNRMYRAAGDKIIDVTNKKILFVCTGNTCRSPMAEAILNDIAKRKNLNITAESAGLYAGGSPASDYAQAVMKEMDMDITSHVSQQVTKELLEEADLVLTMTNAHKQMLDTLFPQSENKVFALKQWAGENGDISDPFGGDIEEYRRCRDEIHQMLSKGWEAHL